MRTPNNLEDDNEIIIQIMPLPNVPQIGRYTKSDYDTLVVDDEGNRYCTVGLALTDQGNIYPIGYDYFSRQSYVFDVMPRDMYYHGKRYQMIVD